MTSYFVLYIFNMFSVNIMNILFRKNINKIFSIYFNEISCSFSFLVIINKFFISSFFKVFSYVSDCTWCVNDDISSLILKFELLWKYSFIICFSVTFDRQCGHVCDRSYLSDFLINFLTIMFFNICFQLDSFIYFLMLF